MSAAEIQHNAWCREQERLFDFHSKGETSIIKSLFWAGRMANCVSAIQNSKYSEFSKNFLKLVFCKDRYNDEILNEVKNR